MGTQREDRATVDAKSPAKPERMMQAIVQHSYGAADEWQIAKISQPEIADNEVLVRVHAAGLDRGTWHLMTGLPYLGRVAFGIRKPKNPVPGRDVAGTVDAVGSSVTRFAVGDEVFGISGGSFAEYAPAREAKLARKPANLSFEQAAVVPISGLTALHALRDTGRVEAGQRVLIIGASGGVGTFAVQLAKDSGAEVTGVCSTAKMDLVRSLGADHVIDYSRSDFLSGSRRYDLILDIGGNSPLPPLRRALTPTGTLVIVGGEGAGKLTGMNRQLRAVALSAFVHQRLTMLIPKEHYGDLERLRELIEAGKLTPSIDRNYPLAQAPDAMRHLVGGQARGKIAITVTADPTDLGGQVASAVATTSTSGSQLAGVTDTARGVRTSATTDAAVVLDPPNSATHRPETSKFARLPEPVQREDLVEQPAEPRPRRRS
jgi:NADPH:quinone reductase-like Zn-dependent oxidoreductase